MKDSARFALHFGPYQTPQFRFGDIVTDECRGDVTIVELTDAAIPWPIGKKGRARTIVLFGSLVDAVMQESNQAVARAWGVSTQTVTKWRKALDIDRDNAGSMKLRVVAGYDRAIDALPKARVKLYTPEVRAKQSLAKIGIPRPKGMMDALRQSNLGRKPSDVTGARMSVAHLVRGTRPPNAGPAWTPNEDLCLTKSPAVVAAQTGRTLPAVYMRRKVLGITKRIKSRSR